MKKGRSFSRVALRFRQRLSCYHISLLYDVTPNALTVIGFDSANANFFIELGLFPIFVFEQEQPGKDFKIPFDEWPQVIEQSKTKSLRCIAQDYGVSHEAIRRLIRYCNELSEVEIL